MSDLLVRGTPVEMRYVGFEVLSLDPGQRLDRETGDRECCAVVISGTCSIGDFADLGGRSDPWSGPPDAPYLPPGTSFAAVAGPDGAEVGLCFAPAPNGGAEMRVLP